MIDIRREKMEKEKTAFITGHRPVGLPWRENEKDQSCQKFKIQCRQTFIRRNQLWNIHIHSGIGNRFFYDWH